MGTSATPVTVEDSPVLRAICYPAQVDLPTGQTVRRTKLVLTAERVYVFTAPDVLAFSAPYDTADVPAQLAPRSALWTVHTDVGTLTARRMSGCGCGVALKGWQPFTPQRWARG